jgi:uncharacterized membrane protein
MTIFVCWLKQTIVVWLVITINTAYCYIQNQNHRRLHQPKPTIERNHAFRRTTSFRSQNHDATEEELHNHPVQPSRRQQQQHEKKKKNRFSWLMASASIELPFPKQIAYDAFSDLSRQPSFSPWLRSVEYLNNNNHDDNTLAAADATSITTTRWTMSYLGFRYSWDAISTRQDRENGIIEWKSITGLENEGRVEFLPVLKDSDESVVPDGCRMILTMQFNLPRVVTRLIGGTHNNRGARYMEKHMLQKTLQNFRDTIVQEMQYISIPQEQRQQQNHHPEIVTPFL